MYVRGVLKDKQKHIENFRVYLTKNKFKCSIKPEVSRGLGERELKDTREDEALIGNNCGSIVVSK